MKTSLQTAKKLRNSFKDCLMYTFHFQIGMNLWFIFNRLYGIEWTAFRLGDSQKYKNQSNTASKRKNQ